MPPPDTAALINSLNTTEVLLGIICGCLPALRPLVTQIFPRLPKVTETSSERSRGVPMLPFQTLSSCNESGSRSKERFAWALGLGGGSGDELNLVVLRGRLW